MSGLDELLNIIDLQQKESEAGIIAAAESRIKTIREEAERKAEAAYEEYRKKASEKNKLEYENACSAADSAMKRKILAFKVEQVELAAEKTLERLHSLGAEEYFSLLERLIEKHMSKGDGIVSLNKRDLERLPEAFESRIQSIATAKGGSVKLSREAADIEDGFILAYGNISENCSFRAVIEAEKDGVRDTAAKVLFG